MPDHVGRSLLLTLLELRIWSERAHTVGWIPTFALRRATMHPDPERALAGLVAEGLAEAVADGWYIDWEVDQRIDESARERVVRRLIGLRDGGAE